MFKTAKVIINNPSKAVDRAFDYLFDAVNPGDHVIVPFGKGNTLTDGVVIGYGETEQPEKFKKVYANKGEIINSERLELLNFIRDEYVCSYFDALRLLLPPGAMLKKNKGYDGAGDKHIQFAKCIIPDEELEEVLNCLTVKAPAQFRIIDVLQQTYEMPVVDIIELTDSSRSALKALETKHYISVYEKSVDRNPFSKFKVERTQPLALTDEQKEVVNYIINAVDKKEFERILLRGVTGSGKTEVYLQAVEYAKSHGKKAIILVPEISLTPQMSERFFARFGDRVAVLHSALSVGERYDVWMKIKNGEVDIVVGARSAIFAPVSDVGIIVVDEEHETSYKSDMSPKYDAREVAERICRLNDSVLVLASATPSVKTAYRAVSGEIKLLQLKNRYNYNKLPDVDVVDLRYELVRGNRSIFSYRLMEEIEDNLKNKEQTLIFLNRRGYATFVSCRSCGFAAKCPDCDVALTYNKFNETLNCHYCGYTIKNYKLCPKCGSKHIKHFGVGTQKVVDEINKMFPEASVIRMDNDSTREKFSHHKILDKFKNDNIDIMVGTQMITKGLDFPNVTLVGVLAADQMLYVDDYRASEKTFQLITQVCGRAGRGEKPGRAIIQTFCPENWVIGCAKEQDYKEFYKREISFRNKLQYPPFCDVVTIVVSGQKASEVKEKITEITAGIISDFENEEIYSHIIGPSPAPIPKINNRYRWRILVKCISSEKVRKIMRKYIKNDTKKDLLITLDINPNSVL